MSGEGLERPGLQKPTHPEDLERMGRSLAATDKKGAKSIGSGIWLGWRQEIQEEGKHPDGGYLGAFLRGFSAPLGGWLPEGMAEYLADRLAGLHPKPKGRPRAEPPRNHDRLQERRQGERIARAVLLAWAEHRETGTPYPQDAALREVAERTGHAEPEVRVAFSRYRKAALDSLEIDLLNTRYPLPEEEAELARSAVAQEGGGNPRGSPTAGD